MIKLKELITETITFYRGENDSGLSIKNDPFKHAKDVGGIFVSLSKSHAKSYGDNITTFISTPSCKILSYTDHKFWKLINKRMPPNKWLGSVVTTKESLIQLFNTIIDKSKELGYDAVIFSPTDDIGTVILNPSKFNTSKDMLIIKTDSTLEQIILDKIYSDFYQPGDTIK